MRTDITVAAVIDHHSAIGGSVRLAQEAAAQAALAADY